MKDAANLWCEPRAVDSSAVAALSARLLHQADSVDEVASRLTGVAGLDWESPAGRNYSEYVLNQTGSVRQASALLREAASRSESLASTLRSLEYSNYLTAQLP